MNKKEIALGIGIALAVLAVFTASAAADNVVYFDPDPSCAAPGETITVTLWLNATDGIAAMNDDIHFDLNVVNITNGTPGDFPLMWGFVHYGTKVRFGGWTPDGLDRTGLLKLADLTLVANNSGTSELGHGQRKLGNQYGVPKEATWINGTFTCIGAPEVVNKTTTDINVSGTVSGNYTDTHTSNNVSENITEEVAKGRSYLEHKWTIDVISGTKTNVTFHLEAWHTANNESDHFEFAYSTSLDGTYTPMVTVTKTSDDHTYQTATLPNETSGIVYIRVIDTDRSGGKRNPDTIFIDHMFIRSVLV